MYLKSLELFGFKSFPDRTVLNFDSGATVVVGPNGSGKSNISDAMRWVLGEISSRNIRGTRMEDVIFGGTDDRKQMNFAEVSVCFDNSDRQMDIAYDEVTVTRRYYRKGESEYFINRKPVRLRDIHELFMNTGVGREGYSIIGQGRIAEIISQKSDERRSIFEEAAGISKYRYKKEEAESKLSAVDDNLTRLNDIMSELEGRVEPLEKESKRARKYLEYFEIKKRDDISLWLYDMKKLSSDLRAAEDRLALAKNELDIVEEALSTLENQNERIFEAAQESKLRYERLQRTLDESNSALHELDNKIKLTENDILHRTAQIEEKVAGRVRYAAQKTQLEELCAQREQSMKEAQAKTESICRELEALDIETEKAKKDRDDLFGELDEMLTRQKQSEEHITELKIRLSALDAGEKNDSERSRSIEDELAKYDESIKLLSDRADKAQRVVVDYQKRADSEAVKAEAMAAQLDKLKKEKQELIDNSNSVYLEYTAKKHRIDAIRRMEELFEGYAQSVRFVMSEYEAGRIEGTKPVSDPDAVGGRIWGPLSRLITVGSRYTLAIETALGANIQNIVVDDEFTAKKAINHLKAKNAGRATFYPISSMKPRFSQIPDEECSKYEGYLGTADKVISFDKRFEGVIRNILGATLIFDNIDNGAEMAKKTGYRARVVTLDGQVINAGGSFTGGSAKRDSGMLTRKTETDKLKQDTAELSAELERLKASEAECDKKIADQQRQMSSLSSQISMLHSLIGAENTQLEVIKSQLSGERNMRESLEKDLDRLKRGFAERDEDISNIRSDIEKTSEEVVQIVAARQTKADRLGEIQITIEDSERRHGELMISRAEAAKDVSVAEHELEEARQRLEVGIGESDENEQTILRLSEANRTATEELEAMRKTLGELDGQIEKTSLERAETSAKNLEFEQRLNQLRGQIREKTGKKELCFREYTMAEAKNEKLRGEIDKLTSRLWEDYELTHSGAVQCGYPEVTEENRSEILAELNEYKNKLKALGSVNLSAIDEYVEVKERYDFMSGQIADLNKSKENLLEIIFKLEVEMRETFSAAFEDIGRNFKQVFAELFGGGTAELSLTDPENVLESGIEIRVAPPGKIIKSLTLLSGGEQAFVAIALIFSILRVNPTPFCIFDEIEAALDESNVFRFADYLKRYSDKTQFIVITHRRGTMEVADRIYGVTMQERGISKILPLNVAQAAENLTQDK